MDQTPNAPQNRVQIHLSVRACSRAAGSTKNTGAPSSAHAGWRDILAEATAEVFEIMMGASLERQPTEKPQFVADYTAMVGIAGSLCGVFGLRAPSDSARRMAALMLGSDDIGVNENVQDAFGEICNMLAGSFKAKIPGLADGCALSVPTVISGRDYALYSLANGERFELLFSFDGNPFFVTLELHG